MYELYHMIVAFAVRRSHLPTRQYEYDVTSIRLPEFGKYIPGSHLYFLILRVFTSRRVGPRDSDENNDTHVVGDLDPTVYVRTVRVWRIGSCCARAARPLLPFAM